MMIVSIILLSIALSLDIFAITISSEMDNSTYKRKRWTVIFTFSIFQVIFMSLGWLIGMGFFRMLGNMSQALIFAIFAIIGIKMIWEAARIKPSERVFFLDNFKILLSLGLASGFGTLIIGIGAYFASLPLLGLLTAIGISAMIMSYLGLFVVRNYGCKYKGIGQKIFGGIILIGLGVFYFLRYRGIL
jgi:putative Mn2+ efflux pump MntP